MSEILLDVQSAPSTPSAGTAFGFVDTVSKKWQAKNDAGRVDTLGDLENFSTANQTGFSGDTYLAGSSIAIPGSLIQAGSTYLLRFDMVKTAAGTATPILNIRFGTAGTTADTARLVFTFAAGTAVVDTGIVEACVHFRTAGALAVAVGWARITHHLAVTGLTTTGASGTGIILVTSAAFDATVPASIIGASFNGGASFAGTNICVVSQLHNV